MSRLLLSLAHLRSSFCQVKMLHRKCLLTFWNNEELLTLESQKHHRTEQRLDVPVARSWWKNVEVANASSPGAVQNWWRSVWLLSEMHRVCRHILFQEQRSNVISFSVLMTADACNVSARILIGFYFVVLSLHQQRAKGVSCLFWTNLIYKHEIQIQSEGWTSMHLGEFLRHCVRCHGSNITAPHCHGVKYLCDETSFPCFVTSSTFVSLLFISEFWWNRSSYIGQSHAHARTGWHLSNLPAVSWVSEELPPKPSRQISIDHGLTQSNSERLLFRCEITLLPIKSIIVWK